LVDRWQPDLVGLSIMTFQRKTAQATIDLIRTLKPNVRIVVGGYDPTLATESYTGSGPGKVDFIGAISARLRERGNGVRTLPRH
jgi:anaerobic magnesium-protoporphyrin IX monomethyl ester cyclase